MDKSHRGNASQFYVAGELSRRGYTAVITLGNSPNTDILCSDSAGRKFIHIQVKTFVPGNRTCTVGEKAEIDYGPRFFWVLGGIPKPTQSEAFEFYIIPSSHMAKHIRRSHELWLTTLGKSGRKHKDSKVRAVLLPPAKCRDGWSIKKYKNRWDLIERRLKAKES